MESPHALPMAAWISLHVGGLLVAWLSRLSVGKIADQTTHFLFIVSFFAVAVLAALNFGHEFHLAVLSATTLGAMVVATVCDCRTDADNPQLTRFLGAEEGGC